MTERVVPMIHVPDVSATVAWYESIGFTVDQTYGNEGDGLSFAILSFGSSQLMFNQGGQPSTSHRREVDLYIYTNNTDDLYARLKERVDVHEAPHDTFYGMRELIVRDLNRFWITFGESSAFERLMNGVREGDTESVRAVVEGGGIKPETLAAALAVALSGDRKTPEIEELLKQAGAVSLAEVDEKTLQSYVGQYRGEPGIELSVTLKDGKLFAALGGQQALSLMPVDQHTFKPIDFDNYGVLSFNVEAGRTTGCGISHGGTTMPLKRIEKT